MNKVVDVPLEVERVNLIKQRFLTLASFMTLESFLSGWFFEAPIEDIHRENVEEFVAYGFYCRTMEELPLNVSSPHTTHMLGSLPPLHSPSYFAMLHLF